MKWIREKLDGYKAYLIAAGAIIGAVGAWAAGTIELPVLIAAIIGALEAMALRAGIAKSSPAS